MGVYIEIPSSNTLQLKTHESIFFAGQLIGVEGYVEAAASGGLAGINAAKALAGQPIETPPEATAHGALLNYITTSDSKYFQPINTNFGLFPPFPTKIRDKQEKRRQIQQRAEEEFNKWMTRSELS